jgi:1-acylglycerone phosphate reductase
MPLTDVSLPKVKALFHTNVFSVIAVTNTFMPLLLASTAGGGGFIVNISSASDSLPFPFKGTYAMTKAALSSYSRTLSVELAEYGIRVLNVVTAFVGTQLGKQAEPEPWPETSLFKSMWGTPQGAGRGGRMEASVYAKQVVAEVLRGKGWEIGPWRFFGTREVMRLGAMSTPMTILGFLGPNWARYVILKMWPFWKLREAIKGQKKNI